MKRTPIVESTPVVKRSPVLKRTLCGLAVGAGVIAMFLYLPLKAIPPIILALSTLLQLEFYQMAKKYEPVAWFGLLMGAVWISLVSFFAVDRMEIFVTWIASWLVAPAVFALSAIVLFSGARRSPVGSIASTLFGFFYVPFLLGFFILLVRMGAGSPGWYGMPDVRVGLYTLFYLIAVAKLSDTGGFAFGVSMGRHKMCPTISPNKSWEGLAGSMLFASLATAAFAAVAQRNGWAEHSRLWSHITYASAVPIGVVFALVGTAGDLIESRIKRECGVKDSATFMPAGMGGFLDMFDSFIFLPALVYPAFTYFQYLAK